MAPGCLDTACQSTHYMRSWPTLKGTSTWSLDCSFLCQIRFADPDSSACQLVLL